MINYEVAIDMENSRFVIKGPIGEDSIPIEIPNDNPLKEKFIDLFLHKADIERGLEFLQCISKDKDNTVNEGLFIAGLNNCMKCFKYSKARNKLDKQQVCGGCEDALNDFLYFERMRDKHYDHDESGMLQAISFLLVSQNGEQLFSGPPSVIWNRQQLDYYMEGQRLQRVMFYIMQYIEREIDAIGDQIRECYENYSREELISWSNAKIVLASEIAERK